VLLALVYGVGVIAAVGLIARFRTLPGPSVGLALPLQATGHLDGASLSAIVAAAVLLFGLAALVVRIPPGRVAIDAAVRSILVAAWSLTLEAMSLQLTSQASLGFDWGGAVSSPTPWLFATSALLATAGIGAMSSNRSRRAGLTPRVDGCAAQTRAASVTS
jgi:hypothetical protein